MPNPNTLYANTFIDALNEIVGEFYADLIVENRVIIELKSVKDLADIHKAQLITYLKVASIKTGLPINFDVLSIKKGISRISA